MSVEKKSFLIVDVLVMVRMNEAHVGFYVIHKIRPTRRTQKYKIWSTLVKTLISFYLLVLYITYIHFIT